MTQLDMLATLDAIPREHIPVALMRLAARAMEPAPVAEVAPLALVEPDDALEMLTPDEVAARLKCEVRWVYRHAQKLGAVRLSKRKLRIPRRGLDAYLRTQRRK